MGHQNHIGRRGFLVTSFAGGIAVAVAHDASAANVDPKPWGDQAAAPGLTEFSIWVAIAPDDTITVRTTKPEVGNGVMTQSAMLVAEELSCDLTKIQTEIAPVMRDHRESNGYSRGDMLAYFAGRSTKEDVIDIYLQAGASIRERLKSAAATRWKVPVAEVEAKEGKLVHAASGRTLRYGEVAAAAAKVKLASEPKPKPRSAWTLLGKTSMGKLNNPLIVNGSAVYGIDVRLPGMVYAALLQAPVHGGTLKHVDADAVKHLPGVLAVVTVDPAETAGLPKSAGKAPMGFENSTAQHAVAVIAEHYWQARKALDALPVEWDDGAGGHWKTIEQVNQAAIAACDKPAEKAMLNTGDISILSKQPTVVEGTYVTPYAEQACMEPLNGTALVTDAGVELWHPTQHSQQAFWVAADEAGVAPEKVTFHQTYVGGGFGRRVFGNDVRMVVAIARKFKGRPVQVVWSREETTRQGRYRHMVAAKLKAGLDSGGMPQAITVRAASGPLLFPRGLTDSPYFLKQIPNARIESQSLPIHLMVGPYRGPGYHSFVFIVETFIDELATAARMDPLEYRLKLFETWPDKGWAKALTEVADKAGWGKALPKGFAQGIAIGNWGSHEGDPETGTTVAVVATVEATKQNTMKVHTLDVAFDAGSILNKDAVETQLMGGTIFGYNMAMYEGLTLKDGRVVEGNFDTYHIVRTGEIPKINVHFGGLTGHPRFGEIGEPPVGPVGPAIGNAIFKATGTRLRTMPFRKIGLNWA